jgi:predicted LPLAT superfamily acyltransferase/uncharacterized protein (DUF2062 family)
LIIVDDGSDQKVQELYQQKFPAVNERLLWVRHDVNQGKGKALQTAFQFAVEKGFTHLVTLDGDGQHDPKDIQKLIDCSAQNPWSMVVGDRDMQVENVPSSSTFGKKFSNFWVKYQTNVLVADSQSGFRVYPLFYVQAQKFICSRYDFEVEVLTRLIWRGVDIKNVKISVRYFPHGERVSHFHKWKDNMRMTVINTIMTVGAMLHEQHSPFKSSLALGLGVFIGCTPLFGLHFVLAAAFAFALRLNFLYMWIGTNVSIPPLIPFLVIGSNSLGKFFLSQQQVAGATGTGGTASAHSFSYAWIVGSAILGLLLGTFVFAVVYYIKKKQSIKRTKKNVWSGKNQNPVGIWIVRMFLKFLGVGFTYFFLYFVVGYYFIFSRRSRKSFDEYWKVTHPEMGFFKRHVKIYQQILVFAKTLLDRGIQKTSQGLYFKTELDPSTTDFLKSFETKKEGTVMIASHMGGWEMAMTFFASLPTAKRMVSVMHGIAGQYAHDSIKADNKKSEVVFFNMEQNTILKLKDRLNAGDLIGMMGDRPVGNSFELLPFFGKLALFDSTPFRLALACNSDLYFVFSVKEKNKVYKIWTLKADTVNVAGENKEEKIHQLQSQYVGYLESVLKQYPEQWFNFFPFWSEVPTHR